MNQANHQKSMRRVIKYSFPEKKYNSSYLIK